jgi:hypothetical protein
LQFIF